MTEFCARTRGLLDGRRQAGPRRLLCVRIPAVIDHQDALGLDVRALADVGVDVCTLSNSFYTSQRNDVEQHRALAPNVKLFIEMTHAAAGLRDAQQPDDPAIMRATDAQLRTTALEALRRGADGVGLFNFAYYREQIAGDPSPGHEPPFHLMPELRDLAALAARPERHWFVARSFGPGPSRRADWLPRQLKPGTALNIDLRMSAPDPKLGQGLLKIRTREASANMSISARINGLVLEPTAYVEKPIPHPYVTALGDASRHHCYVCPRRALRDGDNVIELAMVSGSEVQLWMVEIVFAG